MTGRQDAMAAQVAARRFPGPVTLVAAGDDVYIEAIGTASFADDTALRIDTIFRTAP